MKPFRSIEELWEDYRQTAPTEAEPDSLRSAFYSGVSGLLTELLKIGETPERESESQLARWSDEVSEYLAARWRAKAAGKP